jgi:hypothetical protein
MLQNGILKLNLLLPNELFKWRKTHMNLGGLGGGEARGEKITCYLEVLLEKKCVVIDSC